MNLYYLIYEDRYGNELDKRVIEAKDIYEARKIRDKIFAECMIGDCVKIKVKK
jgi:hypothetical protein